MGCNMSLLWYVNDELGELFDDFFFEIIKCVNGIVCWKEGLKVWRFDGEELFL